MSNVNNFSSRLQSGFTVLELLVVAPIMILTIGIFISVIVNMTGEVLATRSANVLAYDIQDALNRIEQDVKLSTTFLESSNVSLTTPQGYSDDTTVFKNVDVTKGDILILNTLVTVGNPLGSTSGLVYLADSPNACASAQVSQNTPMTMNVIYFVKNNTLWRRSVMPANYLTAGCNTPWQQPSCLPGVSGVFCKTLDIKLVDNVDVADFDVQYYNTADSTTANTVASDTASSDAVRSAALQSTATVGASLNISETAAGRTISQTATVRATKLDVNASTIAPVVVATTPTVPTVSASITNPTSAVFTWPTVPGATSYTLDYNINGGAWQSGLVASTLTTYTVVAGHTNVVNVRVSATNSAGTSAYGLKSITVPLWATPVLQSGWSSFDANNWSTPGYTKTSTGLVVLRGMVKAGSSTIFTLPAGYRPAEYIMFENSSNQAIGRIDIRSDGVILMTVGSNAWTSLDGIAFMPSGTTFTGISTFLNSWLNYSPGSGDPNWAPAGYMTDGAGRVQTKGLVRAGTTAGGTPMFNIPAGSRPSEYMHFTNVNSNSMGHISIDTSGNVLAKGGGNTYVGTQTMYYPSGRATGATCTTQWCNLTLLNSWNYYAAGYTTPQYTKSSDGMVHIKGLIKGGTSVTASIANLPAGYCPKQPQLMTTVAADLWGRIDITKGSGAGCSINPSSSSLVWTSLDSIHYMAEW
jgi:type II secretory pathway pseudopilin PulG